MSNGQTVSWPSDLELMETQIQKFATQKILLHPHLQLTPSPGLVIPIILRHPQQSIQRLQLRHLQPLLPRQPDRIPEYDLQLHPLPLLPIQQHARRAPARVLLRAAQYLLRRRKLPRQRLPEHFGRRAQHFVHDALEVDVEFRVEGHGAVGAAVGEHRRRVHGRVDGDLVPAHQLQLCVVVGFCVFDSAGLQEVHEMGVLSSRAIAVAGGVGGGGIGVVGEIGADADARPAIVLDRAGAGLGGAHDCDGAEDCGAGETFCIGGFYTQAVLDKDDCGCVSYEACEDFRVVADVGKCFRADEDVVPGSAAVSGVVWVGEGLGWCEVVGAELRGGDGEAIGLDGAIV